MRPTVETAKQVPDMNSQETPRSRRSLLSKMVSLYSSRGAKRPSRSVSKEGETRRRDSSPVTAPKVVYYFGSGPHVSRL